MDQENNFNKISESIDKKYEKIVQDVCHVPRVMNLTDFYRIYEKQEEAINEKYQDVEGTPTVALFAEIFKKFDEYPANLQKPKRTLPMRERLSSTISRSSPTLNDSTGSSSAGSGNKENSLSLMNLHKIDDVPSASETLGNFIKFQKQLKQLNAELIMQDIDKEYTNKLKQLNLFAQQLEKLLPSEKVGKSALSPEEEKILEDLVDRMDDLNFLRTHQDVFRQHSTSTIQGVTNKLENLVDVLSYCLLAVNSFNIN